MHSLGHAKVIFAKQLQSSIERLVVLFQSLVRSADAVVGKAQTVECVRVVHAVFAIRSGFLEAKRFKIVFNLLIDIAMSAERHPDQMERAPGLE